MEIKVQDEKRAALITGLRELADFYEQHPDMPIPTYPTLLIGCDNLAEVETAAKAMGEPVTTRLDVGGPYPARIHRHEVKRQFGSISLEPYWIVDEVYEDHVARDAFAKPVANAARWVYTCEAEGVQSNGYETERAAQLLLDAHRESCTGGSHVVKLVSGELVQA